MPLCTYTSSPLCGNAAPPPQQPTSLQQIEQILKGLDGRKKQWVTLGCKERAHLLRECLSNSMKVVWLPVGRLNSSRRALCNVSLRFMMSSQREEAPMLCCVSM